MHKIEAPSNQRYRFTIKDDVIYVSRSGYIATLDLQGNELNRSEAEDKSFVREIESLRFTDSDGITYRTTHIAGRKVVVASSDDGRDIVLKMPMKEYVFLMICLALAISAIFSALSLVYQFMKNKF